MKDLQPIRGGAYIRKLVAEGEHENQDFKYLISDARKIARSISAFANNSGGRLLIGVKDNGTIAGVRNEEDIYVVEQAARLYCRPSQEIEFRAYSVDTHTVVICATIATASSRPVMSQESDGSWRAYYRVADENIAAHPLMVEAWRLREDDGTKLCMAFSRTEGELMSILNESGGNLEVRELALRLHCPEKRVAAMVARLAASGILEFRHTTGGFAVFPAAEDE